MLTHTLERRLDTALAFIGQGKCQVIFSLSSNNQTNSGENKTGILISFAPCVCAAQVLIVDNKAGRVSQNRASW